MCVVSYEVSPWLRRLPGWAAGEGTGVAALPAALPPPQPHLAFAWCAVPALPCPPVPPVLSHLASAVPPLCSTAGTCHLTAVPLCPLLALAELPCLPPATHCVALAPRSLLGPARSALPPMAAPTQEFSAAAFNHSLLEKKDLLKAAFAYFDRNGDGFISLNELNVVGHGLEALRGGVANRGGGHAAPYNAATPHMWVRGQASFLFQRIAFGSRGAQTGKVHAQGHHSPGQALAHHTSLPCLAPRAQALKGNTKINEKSTQKIMAQVDMNQDGKVGSGRVLWHVCGACMQACVCVHVRVCAFLCMCACVA